MAMPVVHFSATTATFSSRLEGFGMDAEQSELLRRVYLDRGQILDQINRFAPWHNLYRRRTSELIGELLGPNTRVLDAGCGTGLLARALAERVRRWVLVDALDLMIELARKNLCPNDERKFEFLCGDILTIQISESFDLIIMTHAANLFPDLAAVFKKFSALLEVGGSLYCDFDTKFRWAVIEALSGHLDNALDISKRGMDRQRNIVGAKYFLYGRPEIEATLAQCGFEVLATEGIMFVSPLIHVFNDSEQFLTPKTLDSRSKVFLDLSELEKLYELEKNLERFMPAEAAGWMVFRARKKGWQPTQTGCERED
jgi:ubiquinone/menaquinone biosynthesis C-methylase UbiE